MNNLVIDKQNGDVAFNEEQHRYWNVNDSSIKFTSVTTMIEEFGQPFDKEFWSAYKALEKLIPADEWKIEKKSLLNTKKFDESILDAHNISVDAFNREQQGILDMWEEENRNSCERGTKIHAGLENSFYKAKKNISLAKYQIGGKFECQKDRTSLDLDNAVYPEYLIHWDSPSGKLHIAGQIDLLVKKGNSIVIGDWKGLPLDTEILTSVGWKTMQTLQLGDKVFDKDGNLCNVIVKSSVHHNPCYRIKFSEYHNIVADKDHRWFITFKTQKNSPYKGANRNIVMTTEELYIWMNTHKMQSGYNIPRIDIAHSLNLVDRDYILDPYVLGLWLGDGTAANGKITQELNSNVWTILNSKGFELSENQEHRENVKAVTRNVYGLMSILRKLNVLNNKHIPDEYFLGSFNQRLNLLRGLMDADGYYDKTHKVCIMRTNYKWQADGVLKLVNSLGVKATLTTVVRDSNYKKDCISFDVKFKTAKFNPFLCRNQNIELVESKNNSSYNIQSIELVDTVPTQCIQVDSPSHTFLCTKYLLITHNTNKEIKMTSYYDTRTKQKQMMKFPLNNVLDCNYQHYCLQLSTYAYIIESYNPDFTIEDLVLVHFDHNDNMTVYHLPYLKKEVERMLSYYEKEHLLKERRAKNKRIEY